MKFHLCQFLLLLLLCPATAQTFQPLPFPVTENGTELPSPWAGGLNAPQWASADLDGDGLLDLYAFDRNGDRHLVFLSQDATPGSIDYRYDHAATLHFPQLRYFVLLRDFNADGVPDLFASAFDEFQKSIKVYRGRWQDGLLQFDRVTFPGLPHDVLYYEMDGAIVDQVKVFLQFDYPAIDDLDGDGDLDILAMNQASSKVIFYKNITVENDLPLDSLRFELADDCWGKFGLSPTSSGFLLSPSPDECAVQFSPGSMSRSEFGMAAVGGQLPTVDYGLPTPKHGGSTLTTFDADADGDRELLYGDLVLPSITFGLNGGTPEAAWMTGQDTLFPSANVPIDIPSFPATFHLDVDHDGARDLIASPNRVDGTPDRQTVHFYKNQGTDAQPNFQFQTAELLADGILDFGTGAAPAIADVNADGLPDLVVGNRFAFAAGTDQSALALLLNTGTATAPAFEVYDRNWLDFSQFAGLLTAPVPAFGDLDGDGDLDLLIGDEDGNLHFAENLAGPGQPMDFAELTFFWQNIDVGKFATPAIADLNGDGLPDLLVGEQQGNVNYFPNLGTATEPAFEPDPALPPNNFFFGKIITQAPGSAVGHSQPVVLDFGGEKQIVCGSFEGWISRYLVAADSLSAGTFELLDERWGNLREGRRTRLAFADLNADGMLDVVVGNDRGGLSVFRSPLAVDGTVDVAEPAEIEGFAIKIFPNPTTGQCTLQAPAGAAVTVFDLLGRVVFFEKMTAGSALLDLGHLPAGSYFLRVEIGGNWYIERLVVSGK